MKIVYCIQGLWKTGGIERVVSTKVNYWAEQGHDVWIITTDQKDRSIAFPLHDQVQLIDLGLNYEADNSLGRWKRLWALYKKRSIHRKRLEDVLTNIKPDITVSTFFQDAPLLPSIHDGSKKVLELHSSMYRRVFMYPKGQRLMRAIGHIRILLDKRLAKRYDSFVVLTQEDKGYWGNIPPISVIPNPRPFEPEYLEIESRPQKILAIGRYEYEKNFTSLIEIWQTIAQSHPTWRLEIVGDGPLRSSLEHQVKTLNLEGYIGLPHMTRDIKSHYRSSTAVVMLSEYEGLPMVLVEAQTMSLPIIAYACKCGPRDIITDGVDGYLISPGDKEAFAQRLQQLMDNRTLRLDMSMQARKNSERYSPNVIMNLWEDLFKNLIASS